mmetsp:Transcript_30155/g.74913  ORF Transcript_30155/g.74913 Transcript_30155/m.74913 type:complete len:315 (+) Transcript_30155:245-1189(+)
MPAALSERKIYSTRWHAAAIRCACLKLVFPTNSKIDDNTTCHVHSPMPHPLCSKTLIQSSARPAVCGPLPLLTELLHSQTRNPLSHMEKIGFRSAGFAMPFGTYTPSSVLISYSILNSGSLNDASRCGPTTTSPLTFSAFFISRPRSVLILVIVLSALYANSCESIPSTEPSAVFAAASAASLNRCRGIVLVMSRGTSIGSLLSSCRVSRFRSELRRWNSSGRTADESAAASAPHAGSMREPKATESNPRWYRLHPRPSEADRTEGGGFGNGSMPSLLCESIAGKRNCCRVTRAGRWSNGRWGSHRKAMIEIGR